MRFCGFWSNLETFIFAKSPKLINRKSLFPRKKIDFFNNFTCYVNFYCILVMTEEKRFFFVKLFCLLGLGFSCSIL